MADRVQGADGKAYTVSTLKKMGVWEAAVFEGRPGLVSRKNQRYVEAFFDDNAMAARLMHLNVCGMVALIDPALWTMDADDVKFRLKEEADFVTARDPELKYVMANTDRFMASMSYKFLIDHEGEPGLQAARFVHALRELGANEWAQVSAAIRRSTAWSNDDLRDAATPTNEAGMSIVFTSVDRAQASLVRCGVGGEEAQILGDAASRAAAAVLARTRIPPESFASLYAPFNEVIDLEALTGDSFDLATGR